MVARAATSAEVDLVETSACAPAALIEPAARATLHPFDAAIAGAEARVRATYVSATGVVAARSAAVGGVAVVGVVALDQADAANAIELRDV